MEPPFLQDGQVQGHFRWTLRIIQVETRLVRCCRHRFSELRSRCDSGAAWVAAIDQLIEHAGSLVVDVIALLAQKLKQFASRLKSHFLLRGNPGHGVADWKLKVVQPRQTLPKITFGAGY